MIIIFRHKKSIQESIDAPQLKRTVASPSMCEFDAGVSLDPSTRTLWSGLREHSKCVWSERITEDNCTWSPGGLKKCDESGTGRSGPVSPGIAATAWVSWQEPAQLSQGGSSSRIFLFLLCAGSKSTQRQALKAAKRARGAGLALGELASRGAPEPQEHGFAEQLERQDWSLDK